MKVLSRRQASNLLINGSAISLLVLYSILTGFCVYSQTPNQQRDGKLLQGDKWVTFSSQAKADFYVSVKGDDHWSGTLPEPNSTGTDGPFLTIRQAQKVVRDLKSKVFFPKDPPVEKRWIGSPHPLEGVKILWFISAPGTTS